MRKLIMWNLITLDGFFEGTSSWSLEFLHTAWSPELMQHSLDQLASADALLFGRITYAGMSQYWQKATDETAAYMNSLPKLVFSRTLERADWNNTRLVKENAVEEVRELKSKGSGNIFVFGSANLSATLIEAGLFDEYRLAVVPIILGAGRTLFGRDLARLRMNLLEARPLSSGCVILRYQPAAAANPPIEPPTQV